ncbi:MAG: ATP-dependent DNA ligase [Methanomassiliicoccales archaeon]|jgi:DNA ligase-1|nr:ATP-dependent DNA ligase [Methanomassiliicoccales archaeon]
MLYRELVRVYEALESTTSRLEMTDILAEFFKSADCSSLRKIIYLTQGQLYPDFYPQKLGIADKLLLKAISFTSGVKEQVVQDLLVKEGDPGNVAQKVFQGKKQTTLFSTSLTLDRVYDNLRKIAEAEGSGSQELKIKMLADILHDATPVESKYIARIVTGRMRLGVADMTVLDALAQAFAGKGERDTIERAFNITSDLGLVGEILCKEGVEALRKISVSIGNPIRAMLAERLSSPKEILERMGGRCAFEYKYDGVRIQAHIDSQKRIKLFSRRLEDITDQFPDVVNALREAFVSRDVIIEGECVPVDINTGEMLPFQEVSHRRGRKYDLSIAVEDYPVRTFLFDCLYLDGTDLTRSPFLERRRALEKCIKPSEDVRLSEIRILDRVEDVERFFEEALKDGCEGLMAKSIGEDSIYRAGARGFLWIKYKKEYRSEMSDTVDLVVVGAFAGRGRRKGVYGALLMATYNDKEDTFETVCKLGSGFDDATLAALPSMLEPYKRQTVHPKVRSKLEADYWFEPAIVMEVLGSEITLSPTHTCSYSLIKEDAGFAIRFPRFTSRFRSDKNPREATTSAELTEMYKRQLKRIEE